VLKYIITNITISNFPNLEEIEQLEAFIDRFLNKKLNLIDFHTDGQENKVFITLLSQKDEIKKVVLKILKDNIFKENAKVKTPAHLYSISFFPLRMEKIQQLNEYVSAFIPEIAKTTGKGILTLGYLAPKEQPPFRRHYSSMDESEFLKTIKKKPKIVPFGIETIQSKNDIIYVATKPYPVVFYIKIAMDDAEIIDNIFDKLKKYVKQKYTRKINSAAVDEYPLVCTADVFSVPHDTATIAVKINDYVQIPFHKVMIYIYDVLEKKDCIPFDAEFGFPIPSEVIKIASEDLFYDKESPAELSKEIEEVLRLFRFDNDSFFGYPSMLLEKKYNITDILTA